MTDLSQLLPPRIVEEISFELIRAEMVADLRARDPAFTAILESDPAIKVLEAGAYREMILRQRINEAVRANFLAFASGSDIDHLAQFYDVTRLPGESDVRLKDRIVLAITGRSTGGTEARYKSVALGADIRVSDVSVYTVGKDPTINVAVFSVDNNGVADAALLAKVNAALQSPSVRMVNDRIVVAAAALLAINVVANLKLLPDASETVIASAEAALRAAWADGMALGRDVTRAWLVSKLMIAGVYSVDVLQPAADVVMPFNQAAALGTVTLNNIGRAF